jgi:hypothetical protein
VPHVRLHDGRHTAATLLLSENVHPRVVMELLGHSQMRTTMDIYSQVMPALAREAADRMGALLLKKALLRGVELRGLEPLTPTLPVDLDGIHAGSQQSSMPPDLRGERR